MASLIIKTSFLNMFKLWCEQGINFFRFMKESIKDSCWIEYFMKIGSILAYTVEPWGALETAITPDHDNRTIFLN